MFRFTHVPKGYWDNEENVKEYLSWLGYQIGISRLDDWKYVTSKTLALLGGDVVTAKHGGLLCLLSKLFPDHTWDPTLRFASKSQGVLHLMIRDMFPDVEVKFDYHPH